MLFRMAPSVDLAILRTTVVQGTKPYTGYEVSVRLPLQSFVLQKRYSEFVILHSLLTSQAGSPPPATLPPKHWFGSTVNSDSLTESRRANLEGYLKAINDNPDSRWRDTPAWHAFLNLPSSLSARGGRGSTWHGGPSHASNNAVSDPQDWLDVHRELKAILHEARLNVAGREKVDDAYESYEQSANAKKALIKAGSLIANLDKGLRVNQHEWEAQKLGEGEVRRRRDLVAEARRQKEDLERLAAAIARKKEVDAVVQDKQALVADEGNARLGVGSTPRAIKKGRVLGKETDATREMDNTGVLQLQERLMLEQDQDIDALAAAVRKQKELATQINEELELQTQMLELVHEDATRLEGKVKVAKGRIDRVS